MYKSLTHILNMVHENSSVFKSSLKKMSLNLIISYHLMYV